MKTKAICSFFVLFAIVAGIGATTPAAFADPHGIETADNDLAVPGCGETEVGCYTPNTTTVNVGDVVTMTNTDATGIHTFTSGTVDGFAPSPDGIFDSGMLMKPGDSFEYTTDTAGEFPFYCTLHVWMQGVLIVQEAEAEEAETMEETMAEEMTMEEETMMEEEIMIEIATGTAEAGEMLSIDVTFTTISGDSVEHVNYDIKATQNGEVVLNDMGVHDHDGVMNHMTSALSEAASDDAPVEVEVMFNGFGIDPPFTGPVGQVSEKQVVPEFGTIAMMVLAVAIISIVAVTAKSRVIPRF